ncbi:MAG: T9SS type A sorting domain-containing protein [Flavobacteriales bacterium]|jgi:hypothetical protein|nr:T9SS type A sorting domain-containing protein [Flavobacteriales bacterium]
MKLRRISLGLLVTFSLLLSIESKAQKYSDTEYKNNPHWIEMMSNPEANFYETQKAFKLYWEGREITKGCGYKPFKRWEESMQYWVDKQGNKPNSSKYQGTIIEGIKSSISSSNNESTQAQFISQNTANTSTTWNSLGPINVPSTTNWTSSSPGIGRLNTVAFHPTDSNTFYVGAPAGGVWKTTDGGNTYTCLTNQLGTMGISDIYVHKTNPNHIVIGTGDADGSDALAFGFFYSTDAGSTWIASTTGPPTGTVSTIVANPSNPNTLYAAVRYDGVYVSHDAGINWTESISGNFRDIAYHPTDSNKVYAVKDSRFYRTINAGSSWTSQNIGGGNHSRLTIGVSPNQANTVYLFAATGSGFGAFYKSTNQGVSFLAQTDANTPNLMGWQVSGNDSGGQSWYDMAIVVNPTNANEIYVGGVNIWKSINGGQNWSIVTHWYGGGGNPNVHADQHRFRYDPHGRMFICNDGGLLIRKNDNLFTLKSDGLVISQIYKHSVSAQNPNLIMAGFQDNGTALYRGGNWQRVIGGDGMNCIIHPNDSNVLLGSLYYGSIRRNLSSGNGFFTTIAADNVNGITESGAWVTPFVLNEFNPNRMYIGYRNVWTTDNYQEFNNQNIDWEQISTNLIGSTKKLRVLEASRADSNILYAAESTGLKVSKNVNSLSPNWSNVSLSGTPGNADNIYAIETVPNDSLKLFITIDQKVYQSTNGGISWQDINYNLNTSVIKRSLLWVDIPNGKGLYTVDALGVYFLPEGQSIWLEITDGLPNYISARDIKIYKGLNISDSKISIATYGRGIWQAPAYTTSAFQFTASDSVVNLCKGDVKLVSTNIADSIGWFNDSFQQISVNATYIIGNTTGGNIFAIGTYNGIKDTVEIIINNITFDTTIIASATGLSVQDAQADSYQWVTCPSMTEISGATNSSYTPTSSGSYAVKMTKADCETVSSCRFFVPLSVENVENSLFGISPNPFSNVLQVNLNSIQVEKMTLTDSQGRLIWVKEQGFGEKEIIDTEKIPSGIYFLNIDTKTGKETHKVVKE